jgi:hypothetical protein
LCCRHLAVAIGRLTDSRAKVKLARSSVIFGPAAGRAKNPSCPICLSLERTTATLAQAIQRSDGRARFQRTLEAGPLFCHRHREEICSRNATQNFAHIQQTKLQRLTNDLAQAERRAGAESERLVAQTLGYLLPEVPPDRGSESARGREQRTENYQRKVG